MMGTYIAKIGAAVIVIVLLVGSWMYIRTLQGRIENLQGRIGNLELQNKIVTEARAGDLQNYKGSIANYENALAQAQNKLQELSQENLALKKRIDETNAQTLEYNNKLKALQESLRSVNKGDDNAGKDKSNGASSGCNFTDAELNSLRELAAKARNFLGE